LLQNVRTVVQEAKQKGVDPVTAVATMLTESQGNNKAVGDNGSSFGLFQLHKGGELGNMSQQQAFDPKTNADTALTEMARVQKTRGLSGGALAAAAQRPANPQQYAQKVNGNMDRARQLIAEAGVS
jgi:soluble lytic murein transglycosylase-like protein